MGIPLAQSAGTLTRRPRYSLRLVALTLVVCFGEGFGYFLRDAYSLPSPHLFGIPVFFMALTVFYFRVAGLRLQRPLNISLFFVLLATFWLFMQLTVRETSYVLGYGQTVLFIVMLYLTRQVFEQVPGGADRERLFANMLGTALVLHYLQIASIVLVGLVWHATGISLNLIEILSQPEINASYGFRATGISREPAWAAIGLASTYMVIHYLSPARRTMALCGYILAAWLISSGTAYLFGVLFVVLYMLDRRSSLLFIAGGAFALLAIALMTYLQWHRIGEILQGADPSMNMRFASAKVALDVIYESFPVGTGYGNFRLFGVYGAEFDNYVNLEISKRYKSDILLLNIFAELGVAGIAFIAMVYRAIAAKFYVAPAFVFLVTLCLFGTVIVPPLILVAALSGLLAARQPRAVSAAPQNTVPVAAGPKAW